MLSALALFLAACSHSIPSIGGSPAASSAPGVPYSPPKGVVPPESDSNRKTTALPPDIAPRDSSLTLADVVDVSLRNNPQTSLAWAEARTAAYEIEAERHVRARPDERAVITPLRFEIG